MNATEKKYVEKLKEYIHHLRINGSYDVKWTVFESEISALEQQIKEPEDELREELGEWKLPTTYQLGRLIAELHTSNDPQVKLLIDYLKSKMP